MGDQTDNLHLLVGELTGTVKALVTQVSQQTTAIRMQTETYGRFEAAQQNTNDDIKRLREEVVTSQVLRSFGMYAEEPDELRRDMEFLRETRERADERKPLLVKVKTSVIILVVTSLVGWGIRTITASPTPIHIGTAQDAEQ